MSAQTKAQRLVLVQEPEEPSSYGGGLPQAIDERENCRSCFGTGMEVVAGGKGARRCQCRTSDAQSNLLAAAHIPRRYSECALSNYHPAGNHESQLRAFSLAYRLAHEYPAVERGLLLTGPCGVGKTHLAAGIIRGLVERGVPCLFYEFGALLQSGR